MRKKNILSWCVLLVVFLFCTELAFGAYTLDTDFGDNGQISESFGGISNKGFAVVVQPDGAIIVAGSKSSSADQDFSLIRYLADGSYDSSFNIDGRVVTSIGRADDEILAVGLLADGRIVAAGYAENDTDRDFALACYFPDGTLDSSFGDQGSVVMQVGSGHDEITALTITQDNQIIIAGVAEGTSGSIIVVGRFYDDGTLDAGFGEEGLSLIGIGDDAVAEGVLVQGNGRIIISGSYSEDQKTSLALVGVRVDGIVDTGFGVKGIAVASDIVGSSEGYGISATEDDKVYLAAAVERDKQFDAELLRFTADGVLDATFNDTGVFSIYAGPEDDALYDVKILNDAKVAFTGFATRSGFRKVLVGTYGVGGSNAIDTIEQNEGALEEPVQVSDLQVVPGTLSDGSALEHAQEIQVRDSFDQFLNNEEEARGNDVETALLKGPQDTSAVQSLLHFFIDEMSSFFVGQAVAAELTDNESDEAQVTILSSENGDAAGNALTVLENGEVVVVGTSTDNHDIETMTVTKLSDSTDTATVTSLASATSSFIRTTPVSAINRTGALTGGEILVGLGTVTKKGVVFSIAPYPQYKSSVSGDDDDDFTVSITNPTSGEEITTESFTLSVTTSLASQCGYNQEEDADFDSMEKFSDSEATTHSAELTLDDGEYTYYVKCELTDDTGDYTAIEFVKFTVKVEETVTSHSRIFEKMLRTTGNFFVAEAVAAGEDTSDEDSDGLFGTSSNDDFVTEGETEDGSGNGKYSSILENLKPGTIFYVRAYAIVGGTVFYGDELTFRTDDSCFIATASYGSVFHPMVEILRDFRDSYLLQVESGRKFVDFYYAISPPVADFIASRAWMRFIVRLLLLPFIGFSWLSLHMGIWQAVGTSVTSLLLVGYIVVRTKNVLSMRVQH